MRDLHKSWKNRETREQIGTECYHAVYHVPSRCLHATEINNKPKYGLSPVITDCVTSPKSRCLQAKIIFVLTNNHSTLSAAVIYNHARVGEESNILKQNLRQKRENLVLFPFLRLIPSDPYNIPCREKGQKKENLNLVHTCGISITQVK